MDWVLGIVSGLLAGLIFVGNKRSWLVNMSIVVVFVLLVVLYGIELKKYWNRIMIEKVCAISKVEVIGNECYRVVNKSGKIGYYQIQAVEVVTKDGGKRL